MFITGGTKNNHAPEAKALPVLLKPLPQFPQALLTVITLLTVFRRIPASLYKFIDLCGWPRICSPPALAS